MQKKIITTAIPQAPHVSLSLKDSDQLSPNDLKTMLNYQQALLPDPTEIPKYLKAGFIAKPLKVISGDFYDHWLGPDGSLYLFLGDMVGHGPSAAYGAMLIKGYLSEYKDKKVHILEIIKGLNAKLCRDQKGGYLTLMFTGIIIKITPQGVLKSVSAGHPPLVIIPASGKHKILPRHPDDGMQLFGLPYDSNEISTAQRYQLQAGDRIYLYTDGVTERLNPAGKGFGLQNLVNYLQENKGLDLAKLLNGVEQKLNDFAGGREPNDDLTLIGLEYTP
ncbi:MAG: PP2C family protein-serine/threonine phosphatase [Candidatus Margulisiibacteriota bacterium]|jgi:sigma-B regulation protein RsbU (phosphoserine phosphatase)